MKNVFPAFALLVFSTTILAESLDNKSSKPQKLSQISDSDGKPSDDPAPYVRKTKSSSSKIKDSPILDTSSQANRMDKTFSLTFEPIGFAPLPVYAVAPGYYLSPDHLLELSHAQGEFKFLDISIDNSLTTLRLKSFWANSFYTNLGVGQRTLGYKFSFSEIDSNGRFTGKTVKSSVHNAALGLDFAIGNRWQWSNFTLGCDWIGLFSPLSTTGQTTAKGTNIDPEAQKDANRAMDVFTKRGTAQFLRFYLGVSF